jgi:hypothetical protein
MEGLSLRKVLTAPVTHRHDVIGFAVLRSGRGGTVGFRRRYRLQRWIGGGLNVTDHAIFAGPFGFGTREPSCVGFFWDLLHWLARRPDGLNRGVRLGLHLGLRILGSDIGSRAGARRHPAGVQTNVYGREITKQGRVGIRACEFRLDLSPGHLGIEHEEIALAGEQSEKGVLVIPVHFDPDQVPVGPIWNEVLINLRNRERRGQVLRAGIGYSLNERPEESLQNIAGL